MFMADAATTTQEATTVQAAPAQAKAPAKRQRAATAAAPGAAKKRTSKKQVERVLFFKSSRKRAVARSSIRKGTGIVRVNGFNINTLDPVELRALMLESLHISNITEDFAKGVDIDVSVNGGGQSGQAQAVRGAIAKAISGFADGDTIRAECMRYDRSLLVDDPRRVEPKKFLGPKARARFQKSYR
jgi:small subunit ribosomal protein S9